MPMALLSPVARESSGRKRGPGCFMAVGMKDPVIGPPVMTALGQVIRNCPSPLELPEAGHFVQEAGEIIVREAMKSFGSTL